MSELITAEAIEQARQAVKDARRNIERFTELKAKALENNDMTAHRVYSNGLEIWKRSEKERREKLVELVLAEDFQREGVWAS